MDDNNEVVEENVNNQNEVTEENDNNQAEEVATEATAKTEESTSADGFDQKDKEDNKLMAVLCYLGILVLIPYFTNKDSKWVKHHSIQGLNLLIVELIGFVIGIIPFIGAIASTVIGIFTIVVSIIGIINVLNCEEKELPLMNNFQFIKK